MDNKELAISQDPVSPKPNGLEIEAMAIKVAFKLTMMVTAEYQANKHKERNRHSQVSENINHRNKIKWPRRNQSTLGRTQK